MVNADKYTIHGSYGILGECRMSFFPRQGFRYQLVQVVFRWFLGVFLLQFYAQDGGGHGKTLRYNNYSSSDRAAILARLNNKWFPCAFLLLVKTMEAN